MRYPMILSCLFCSSICLAEETTLNSNIEQGLSRLQSLWAEASDGQNWQVAVGLGAAYAPEVMGGEKYEASLMQSLDIAHRSGFFVSTSKGLGWSYAVNPNWQAAIFLTASEERDEKDKLTDKINFKGMGNIKSGAQAGLALNYTLGDLELSATLLNGLANRNKGRQITIGADYTAYGSEHFALILNSELTASSSDYQQRWFGVTAQQAKQSGFKAYQAGSGLTQGSVGVTAIVPLNKELRLVNTLSYKQLLGDAADSPLVKSKGSAHVSSFLQYTW